MIWITSDTHFSHALMISPERMGEEWARPWATVEDMDEAMITNWNRRVSPGDTVWHLGDVALRGGKGRLREIRKRLNGRINLVKGNHDWPISDSDQIFDKVFEGLIDLELDGQPVTLCHYRMMVWNKSHYGSWLLYGHSHGKLVKGDGKSRAIDVGVDARHLYFPHEIPANSYCPWSWEEIRTLMQVREIVKHP